MVVVAVVTAAAAVVVGRSICGPRGFGDLGRTAIYFHGAWEHW